MVTAIEGAEQGLRDVGTGELVSNDEGQRGRKAHSPLLFAPYSLLPVLSVIVCAAEVVAAVGADELALVAAEAVRAVGADLAVMIDLCVFG